MNYTRYFMYFILGMQVLSYKRTNTNIFFSKLVNMFSECMRSLINSCCEHAKAIYISFKRRKSKVE